MAFGLYILVDGEPVEAIDVLTWGRWMSDEENVRVALFISERVMVSTVFLGLDTSLSFLLPNTLPVLFETMVFCEGEEYDRYQRRYQTLEEAMIGHEQVCAMVGVNEPENNNPDDNQLKKTD